MLRKITWLLLVLAFAQLVSGCTSTAKPANLPPPIEATTIGVGDVFELRIVGEEKLPTAFTVAPDGTVDLPYVKRLKVAGMEPQEISESVRKLLLEKDIYRDPIVTVAIREYNSKRIEILGQVQKPGSIPIQPGITLLRAIALAGGFNNMAWVSRVQVRRHTKEGTVSNEVSAEAIMDNRIPDVPLQAGDSINVPQKPF